MEARPRSTNIHYQLESVCLYRDDLERILGLLRDAGLTITITDESFRYQSLEEVQKAQGQFPIRIGDNGTVTLDL